MKCLVLFVAVCFFTVIEAQIKVDYRPYQSSVKNQKNRGTCTAFSICSALETFPGFPSDLSEQYIYALAKSTYYKEMPTYEEGGFLKYYIGILQKRGTLSEEMDPYNPNSEVWNEDDDAFDKMKKDVSGSLINTLRTHGFYYKLEENMYQYRSGKDARDVEWVKSQLDKGIKAIPVCYGMSSRYWGQHTGSRLNKIKPDDFIRIVENGKDYSYSAMLAQYPDLATRLHLGTLEYYFLDTNYRITGGHAVAIVGYDESGFLIKNSWGVDEWGDKGYGWVSFDYHRLLANEVMSLHLGKVSVVNMATANQESWKKENIYVKTLPHNYYNPFDKRDEKSMDISFVYHGNRCMPRMKEVEIVAFDVTGKNLGTWYGSCQGIFDGRETGYGAYILRAPSATYPTVYKLMVNFTVETGEKFTNTYYNLTSQNQEYKPGGTLQDLLIGK